MTEKEYLETYNENDYARLSVAVDVLVFTIEEDKLKIVLIERDEHPYKNMLSLPGVFVGADETLDEAALRGIKEETGLSDIYFEQLYTWGDVERDPRMRIISVSYLSLVPSEKINLMAGKRTVSVALYDVDELLSTDRQLAFDHRKIIEYARERIKNKVEYTQIAYELLPEEFTLPQLQKAHEILLGKTLYKTGFRRKVTPMIEETERMTSGDAHRPSKYYRLRTMDMLFFKACQNGQKGVAESFLKKGDINVDRIDNEGFAPLHYACRKGTREIVRMLIEYGADVNVTSNEGITPLQLAVTTGSKEIIKMLVDAGADVNATDNSGKSVLIYGIKAGRTEAVRYLKELGADISCTDNEGRTAIDYANVTGLTQMVENVMDANENKRDSYGNTPLHQSCCNGHSEVVKLMLQKESTDVNATNDIGETPLYIAVRENNMYITELLIQAGADANKKDNDGLSPLHVAARKGKVHIVGALVKGGADVNCQNKHGETPLICAIKTNDYEKGNIDIVEILLECGADVNYRDMWGKSALYYAVMNNNNGIVQMLLDAGAEE